MKLTFDHLGLVVESIGRGRVAMQEMLNICSWTEVFNDPINGVIIQFGRDSGGICYELLEPLDERSPVFAALSNRKHILNHLAYRVENLADGADHMVRSGCVPTSKAKPAIAYGGRKIQFFVTPLHFVVELIEAWEHQHGFHDLDLTGAS